MQNITIGRSDTDPDAQGVIRPADDRWQLVIDKDGYPHLYVRVHLEATDHAAPSSGLLCIEDVLPAGTTIRGLMDGVFGGTLSPEEEQVARAEYQATRDTHAIPCPR